MKKLLMVLFTITILLSCNVYAQEKNRIYDNKGQYQGYTIRKGEKIKIYDNKGQYQGFIIKSGDKFKIYDKKYQYKGYFRKGE